MDTDIINLVHLIPLNKDITLFFHTDSLQIYPLKSNDLICDFVRSIEQNGIEKTKLLYSVEDFHTLYDYISNQIKTSPKTLRAKSGTDNANLDFSSVILPISGKCNLKCPYCFAQTDNGFQFKDYTYKDIDCVIDFLVKKNNDFNKVINIAFFGGEPLLKFDSIKYTVQLLKEKYPKQKVAYSITTNGTIFNDEIINFLKDNHVAILLSMDGPENEFNLRRFRNGKSSVNRVLKNINLLKENGLSVDLRATMVSNNPYVVETFDFFENLNCPFNIVFAYFSENKSFNKTIKRDFDELKLIEEQLSKLIDYYRNRMREKKRVFSKIIPNIINTLQYRIVQELPCSAGKSFFTITSNGDIYSCSHFMNDSSYCIGNISTGITKYDKYVPVEVDEIEECAKCWAKYLCNGGCMSQKISMGKSANTAKTPGECALEKIMWEFYIRMYYYVKENEKA